MKKLTFLIAAIGVAMMSFAAGGNITYELNGGVTNDHGWQNKNDMYMGLNQAWNTFSGGTTVWKTLDELVDEAGGNLEAAVPLGIPTQAGAMDVPFIQDADVAAEWQWLVDYMDAACDSQGKTLPSGSGAFLRYNFSAFFLNSVRPGWPASADYTVAGLPEAFIPAWKHGFAGPESYDGTEDVVLPAPYKEGESFLGWYLEDDFSGEKVTVIEAGTEGDITLYAHFGEYIPTLGEVAALEAGVDTKTAGVVTLVDGAVVYIQDASAGLMVEFAAAEEVQAGDAVVVDGTTAALGAYIKLSAAELVSKSADKLPNLQNLTIPVLKDQPADFMFEYVQLQGLTVVANAGGVLGLQDADKNAIDLRTAANVAVGKRVNVKAVVSYDDAVILVASAANVEELADGLPADPATYDDIEDGKYSLQSQWLVSSTMDNLAANRIGVADYVRGMIGLGGKMYFIDRNLEQLTVLDGATGERLDPVKLADYIFTTEDEEGNRTDAGTLRFNDIKVDSEGNVLLGNCITSNVGVFQVWKVDLETGEGELVVEDVLADNIFVEAAANTRFDAFGVYGDVEGDAIIMAANASGMDVFKWTIEDGEVVFTEQVIIDTSAPGTLLEGAANPGTAPQVFPMDEDYFYLDGNATLPTLIDMDGNIIDGFYNTPTEEWAWDTATDRKQGHNGLIEFEVAGEHFFLIASGNTVATPPSTFTLFKWKDANKEFEDIEYMWTFPKAGMGGQTNAYRTAVPSVEVDEENNIAHLYVYTGENGYGLYNLVIDEGTGVTTPNGEVIMISVNGRTVQFDQPLADVTVYSVNGQLQNRAANVSSVNVVSNGVFIVKAITQAGETFTQKVIVK